MEALDCVTSMEKVLCARAEMQKSPINGILELTPLCNMNCRMCYVRLSKEEMQAQGRLRTGGEWLALGREMCKAGVLFLLLTGGEPLLHPDFREIYLGLKKLGMILTVNTNGTLIDEGWAEFFEAHRPRRINITLYGAGTETYARLCGHPDGFDRTVRAVRLLRERGVDVKLNGSITPANKADAEQIISLANELDVPYKLDTYMYPAVRERNLPYNQQARLSPEDAARMHLKLLKLGKNDAEIRDAVHAALEKLDAPEPLPACGTACRAGSSSFMINWQGQMRPCIMVNTPSEPVFDLGFDRAWESIREQTMQIHLSKRCAACDKRGLCPACAASALLESGDYAGTPEYLCRYTEETLRLLRQEEAHAHG